MMKHKLLQQKLNKLSIIAVAGLSALGAATYGVYSWSSSLDQEFKKTESDLRNFSGDLSLRRQKSDEADKYLGLYQKLVSEEEQEKLLNLNRDKAQKWISAKAAELRISNLTGSFDPVTPIDSPEFKKKTLQGIASKVSLTFAAMTDEQLFLFVEAIKTDFPGYTEITKATFEKKGDIDDDILLAAGRGSFTELVSGSIEFNWIAMKKLTPGAVANEGQPIP